MSAAVGTSSCAPSINTLTTLPNLTTAFIVRPVPSELHAYVNSQTITLSHKKGTPTKYERAIDILDVYGVVQPIVDKVVGEDQDKTI